MGEIARRVTRKNDGNESDLPLTISAQYGLVDQRTFFNNQVASKDMSGYYLLKKGEFAYNKSTSTDSPWGAIKRLINYNKGCVSTLYICFDLIDADPDFLVTYYETNRWYKSVQLIAAEGARNHGLLNIAPDDFFDTVLSIPGQQQEQKLIGNYFSNLDKLITLHQRKLRKGLPTHPLVWEQRKFSDLTDRVSIQSSDSDLPQVEYEDIISGEGTLNKDLRDKEGGKTGIKFYAGDVLYGKLRPYLMNWLYPQFTGVAVGDFWVLRATEYDSSFLYRLVQTDSFQRIANVSSGSKMPRADWNLISQSFFAVPADYAEQTAIAKSLAELDRLITLHQRQSNSKSHDIIFLS